MKILSCFLFLFLYLCSYSQINLSAGLTACYAFDGNAQEPVNALTGVLSGPTPTLNRFGNANTALYFNGAGQSVSLPNSPLLKPAEAVSFSCWIYGTAPSNAYLLFTQNNLGAFFEAYELCIESNMTFMTRKSGSAGLNQVNSTTPFMINRWYHLAMSIDNAFVKLYVNGQLEGQTPSTFAGFDYMANQSVNIGASNSFFDAPFAGIVDNARFYNRTLSAAEVQALFMQDPECAALLAVPVAQFVFPAKTYCVGEQVICTNTSYNNPSTYSWTSNPIAATQSFAGSTNFTFKFGSPGIYTITLIAANSSGVSAPYSQTVTISACAGIEERELEMPQFYPNPASTSARLRANTAMQISLRNILGQVFYPVVSRNEDVYEIMLTDFPAGIYFVDLKSETSTRTQKLLVER